MNKLKIFRAGIIALAMGVAFGIHSNLSTYMDEEGVLHENFSTPLSAILVILGIVLFFAGVVIFFLKKLRK